MTISLEMKEFLKKFNKEYKLCFETGTHVGDGAELLSDVFSNVVTCEPDPSYYKKSVNRLKNKNVKVIFAKSEAMLADIEQYFWEFSANNAVYYLDAHWSAGPSGKDYGKPEQCPLAKELSLINKISHEYFIIIDDYDLFHKDRKLEEIYDENHWITFDQIINSLKDDDKVYEIFEENHPRYLIITNQKQDYEIMNFFKKINKIK